MTGRGFTLQDLAAALRAGTARRCRLRITRRRHARPAPAPAQLGFLANPALPQAAGRHRAPAPWCCARRMPTIARCPAWSPRIPTPPSRGSPRCSSDARRRRRASTRARWSTPSARVAAGASIGPLVLRRRALRASARGAVLGPGCVHRRGLRGRRGLRTASRASPWSRACAWAGACACIRARCSAPKASAWRWTPGRWLKVPQLGGVLDRRRLRDRRQHHHRPRRDRGHRARGGRAPRQPDPGRPQRPHRRAHRHGRLRRRRRFRPGSAATA